MGTHKREGLGGAASRPGRQPDGAGLTEETSLYKPLVQIDEVALMQAGAQQEMTAVNDPGAENSQGHA